MNIARTVVEFGAWVPVNGTLVFNRNSIAPDTAEIGTGPDKTDALDLVWKEVRRILGEGVVSQKGDEWVCTHPLRLYEARGGLADLRREQPFRDATTKAGKAMPKAGMSGFAEAVERVVEEMRLAKSGAGRRRV